MGFVIYLKYVIIMIYRRFISEVVSALYFFLKYRVRVINMLRGNIRIWLV